MAPELSLCAQDVRKNNHDQFLCGLFAPENKRETVFALQVLHMETLRIRDLVKESHLGLIRLQWWRDLAENACLGKEDGSEHGSHKEVIKSLKKSSLNHDQFERYFNARSFDMEDRAPDDLKALLRYCEATGGVIAQMKAQVLGTENENLLLGAQKIGTAATLCDILKTLPFQARSGRTKLPKNLVKKHGLNMKDFFDFNTTPPLNLCVEDIVNEIKLLIKDARELPVPRKESLHAVLLMSVSIEDYLNRLNKVNYDPFNPQIGGGRLKRQLRMAYLAWRGKF